MESLDGAWKLCNFSSVTTPRPETASSRNLIGLLLVLLCTTGRATAAEPESCVMPPTLDLPTSAIMQQPQDSSKRDEVLISADKASLSQAGTTVFEGNVAIQYRDRVIIADRVQYHQPSAILTLEGNVRVKTGTGDFFDSGKASINADTNTGNLQQSRFFLGANGSQGQATNIVLNQDKSITLNSVHFSTCPADKEDWSMSLRQLTIDRESDNGIGRHVVLRVKGVPVFYTPYLRFPLGNRRQSGLLAPEFGHSDKLGDTLSIPYYINLAPNYDATVTARWMSSRGLQAQGEYRYLGKQFSGQAYGEMLSNDSVTGTNRSYLKWQHQQSLATNWSAKATFAQASDGNYFNDLSHDLGESSITHLDREASLTYAPRDWRVQALVSDYQILDSTLAATEVPYQKLPQIQVRMRPKHHFGGVSTLLEMEASQFQHKTLESATRVNLNPGVRLPLIRPWGYVVPELRGIYTAYQNRSVGTDTAVSSTIFSIDSGLLFERPAGSAGGWRQTLEPRLFYVYSPYIDQSTLPLFDTIEADFNFDRMFRANRFIGGDRIGDSNQVSVAVISRLLDNRGAERLKLQLGQTFYLADRRVSASVPPSATQTAATSETLLEGSGMLRQHWYLRSTWAWANETGQIRQSRQFVQYQPAADRILNVGYRYSAADGDAVDASTYFKLGSRWSLFAGSRYALAADRNLDSYGGLIYQSCCWSIQLNGSRRVDTLGQQTSAFAFELAFKGLGGSSGGAGIRPLERSVFFDR